MACQFSNTIFIFRHTFFDLKQGIFILYALRSVKISALVFISEALLENIKRVLFPSAQTYFAFL